MHERELERKHRDNELATDDHATPGRANSSAGLVRRAEPQASGILMRKARDENGVAADAGDAVATAASSNGASLPGELQRKFESSLGTDLSSVRVHTGGTSETAANAVGARAYAVGQDIHFGAGSFDPSSQAGQHLIAHEVAHTVQQRGGSPTRQNKLAVSSPFDAAEHEADRAADAMITGAPFQISGAPTKIARDYRTDLDKAADEGGQQAQSAKPDQVMSVSTIKDKTEAARAHGFISTWTAELNEALPSKDAAPYMLNKNNEALADLQQFQSASAAQDQGLANFKLLYKNVQVAYARLNSMAATTGSSLTDKNVEKGVSKASGVDLAKDHIGNAARDNKGTSALAARAQKLAAGDEQLAAKLKALQATKEPLEPQVNEVVKAQSESTNSIHKITSSAARLTGLDSHFSSDKLQTDYAAAKAKVDELNKSVEDTLGLLIDVTKTAVDPATTAAKAAQFVGEKIGPKLAVMAAKAAGVPGLEMTPDDDAKKDQAEVEKEKSKVADYNSARTALMAATNEAKNALTGFLNKVALLSQKKEEHRKAMDELGTALDAAEARAGRKTKPGEVGTFRTMTTFIAEADTFLADARAARDVGKGDLARGNTGSVAQVTRAKQIRVGSIMVYIPTAWQKQPADGPKRFNIASQTIKCEFGGKDSAADTDWESSDGGLSTIEKGIHAIEKFIEEIEAYRAEMRAGLGV